MEMMLEVVMDAEVDRVDLREEVVRVRRALFPSGISPNMGDAGEMTVTTCNITTPTIT